MAFFTRLDGPRHGKVLIMTEMSPISVKRWKPVWIRDRILSLDVTSVACNKINLKYHMGNKLKPSLKEKRSIVYCVKRYQLCNRSD